MGSSALTRARARTGLSAGPGHGSIYLSPGLSPAASWLLGMTVRALPPQVLLAFPASALASLASTGSCTLPSPTSPPSTGACVVHLPAACSAPAPMGPPRASSTCLVREVLVGTQGGLGARAHPPTLPYSTHPSTVPKARLSATFGFNPCVNTGCGKPAVRPLVDTGAMVFVVFGIIGLNRTRQVDNHVIGDPVGGPALGRCHRAPDRLAEEHQPWASSPTPSWLLRGFTTPDGPPGNPAGQIWGHPKI